MAEPDDVEPFVERDTEYILTCREVLDELREWSDPVRIKAVPLGNGRWELLSQHETRVQEQIRAGKAVLYRAYSVLSRAPIVQSNWDGEVNEALDLINEHFIAYGEPEDASA